MSNSPRRKIEITEQEIAAARNDAFAADQAFDFLHIDRPEVSNSIKVAVLLLRIKKLEQYRNKLQPASVSDMFQGKTF